MAPPIDHLERELRRLEQTTTDLAVTLQQTCGDYLTRLAAATRQQMVLAIYHLCTHSYPQQFLALSKRQREDLQQQVQHLSRQAQQQILEQQALVVQGLTPSAEAALVPRAGTPANPLYLLQMLEQLDQRVIEVLHQLSHATNRALQQAGILPPQLPEPIFEVMAKAGDVAEVATPAQPPHLLKLLVEVSELRPESEPIAALALAAIADETAEDEDAADSMTPAPEDEMDEDEAAVPPSRQRQLTPLVTLHLRLTELEFGDPLLATQRQQLRTLRHRLKQLAKTYRTKRRQYAIAEAEAAWRASWVEE